MRNARRVLGIVFVLSAMASWTAMPAAAQTAEHAIVELRLDGVVDPFVANYVRGGIDRANEQGAAAVLITIDTPGGLSSSMREITQAILNSKVPIIGYVSPLGARAASAGTFILLACNIAAMAPGTNVGAAHPVGLSGAIESEKATNDAAASIRAIAETRGRNADWAESAVRDSVSVSAQEAVDLNVIDLIAPDVRTLLEDVNGEVVTVAGDEQVTLQLTGAAIDEQQMNLIARVFHGLLDPNLAFIFFWLGLGLVILELIVPGHIFSGTIGTILLILAFVSFGVLPVRIIGIALLVLSVIAFIIELKAPGFGVWGGIAIVSLLLGGWFLYDRAGGVEVSPAVLVGVAIFAGLFFGLVVVKALAIRHVPPAQLRPIVGADGVALHSVGPNGGMVRVSAEEWQAVTAGERIREGTPVHVLSIDGLVLTVEAITDEHAPAGQRAPVSEGGNPA